MGRQGQRKAADISPVGAPPPCGNADSSSTVSVGPRGHGVKTACGVAAPRGRRWCRRSCRAATAPGRPRAGTARSSSSGGPPRNAPAATNSSWRATISRSTRAAEPDAAAVDAPHGEPDGLLADGRLAQVHRDGGVQAGEQHGRDERRTAERARHLLLVAVRVDLPGEDREGQEQQAPHRQPRGRCRSGTRRARQQRRELQAAGAEALGGRVRRRQRAARWRAGARDDAGAGDGVVPRPARRPAKPAP